MSSSALIQSVPAEHIKKINDHKDVIRTLHAYMAKSPKPLISPVSLAKAMAFSATALPVLNFLIGQPGLSNAFTTTAAIGTSAVLAIRAHDTNMWHEQAQVMVLNKLYDKLESFLRAEYEAELRRKTMSNLDRQFFASNLWHALQALAESSEQARINNKNRVMWLLSPIEALPVHVIDHKENGFDKYVEVNWPEVIKQLGLEGYFRLKRVNGADGGHYERQPN